MTGRPFARPVMALLLAVPVPALLRAQGSHEGPAAPVPLATRWGIAAGMGVSYADAGDVVDVVNSVVDYSDRSQRFRAGVEFFGAVVVPLSDVVSLKLDYAYLLLSYNGSTPFGPGDFTVKAHLPTLVLQYVLVDEGLYNVKGGAGVGYHFGGLSEQYGTVNGRFNGSGAGGLLELEANTALGDHLFAYLGGTLRWDFIGTLTDDAGRTAGVNASGDAATLRFFSAGARLGLSYYF